MFNILVSYAPTEDVFHAQSFSAVLFIPRKRIAHHTVDSCLDFCFAVSRASCAFGGHDDGTFVNNYWRQWTRKNKRRCGMGPGGCQDSKVFSIVVAGSLRCRGKSCRTCLCRIWLLVHVSATYTYISGDYMIMRVLYYLLIANLESFEDICSGKCCLQRLSAGIGHFGGPVAVTRLFSWSNWTYDYIDTYKCQRDDTSFRSWGHFSFGKQKIQNVSNRTVARRRRSLNLSNRETKVESSSSDELRPHSENLVGKASLDFVHSNQSAQKSQNCYIENHNRTARPDDGTVADNHINAKRGLSIQRKRRHEHNCSQSKQLKRTRTGRVYGLSEDQTNNKESIRSFLWCRSIQHLLTYTQRMRLFSKHYPRRRSRARISLFSYSRSILNFL